VIAGPTLPKTWGGASHSSGMELGLGVAVGEPTAMRISHPRAAMREVLCLCLCVCSVYVHARERWTLKFVFYLTYYPSRQML
jgi:hypothetical protein